MQHKYHDAHLPLFTVRENPGDLLVMRLVWGIMNTENIKIATLYLQHYISYSICTESNLFSLTSLIKIALVNGSVKYAKLKSSAVSKRGSVYIDLEVTSGFKRESLVATLTSYAIQVF